MEEDQEGTVPWRTSLRLEGSQDVKEMVGSAATLLGVAGSGTTLTE